MSSLWNQVETQTSLPTKSSKETKFGIWDPNVSGREWMCWCQVENYQSLFLCERLTFDLASFMSAATFVILILKLLLLCCRCTQQNDAKRCFRSNICIFCLKRSILITLKHIVWSHKVKIKRNKLQVLDYDDAANQNLSKDAIRLIKDVV